jgi:sensor histidine kinase YesM
MERYPFIFSDRFKYRVARHFLFWSMWWIFQIILYGYVPVLAGVSPADRFLSSAINGTFFLTTHMFMAYTLMYFVIPKFIVKGKYLYGAIAVAITCLITALLSSFIERYILNKIREDLFYHWGPTILGKLKSNSLWLSLLAGLRGGLTIGGLAAAIKLMKHWYVKEQRNLQLQKEKTESQLQLLKAQVHPHFLFNTLNNIYAHTQGVSPVGSKLVMGLSDMLRYMLYECGQPFVPLSKELQLIRNYVNLEKIRYGNRLDVHIDLPKETHDLEIAPLLLLPFVENCFKHGASHMIDQAWVSLHLTIEDPIMKFKLVNGKAQGYQPKILAGGIGISNVHKRLELLYPEKFSLDIQEEEEVYIVNLKIELQKMKAQKEFKTVTLSTIDA